MRHFLTLDDLSKIELRSIIERGLEFSRMHRQGAHVRPLPGRVLAMIFEKASTRTRLSFEAGMAQLGGHAIFLSPDDTQLGRGEPIEDTARVISGMCDAAMIRTSEHQTLERFAAVSRVPVINGLTDHCHPCQLLADLQTFQELRGEIAGRTVAWLGDGNNVCNSWINAARLLGFTLRVACPDDFAPDPDLVERAGGAVVFADDPATAVADADLVVTDVWASMGQESEQEARSTAFADYQVGTELMAQAAPDALFMHCLPAHRGEEVTAEVIDGPQSCVWLEAENRLHAQKALLEFLLA